MSREAELIVALDLSDPDRALELVDLLGAPASFYKVGLELYTAAGPGLVRELGARRRKVFLDLKLHDIPNTAAAAARVAAEMGVQLLTLHAAGGSAMLAAARRAVEGSRTRLLAVTALTSLSGEELGRCWGRGELDPAEEVLRLARLAMESGAHGVVASAREAGELRAALGPAPLIVTPGIRPPGWERNDQHRVSTPAEAVRAGADFLVVGRPITRAPDPGTALAQVRSEMEGALAGHPLSSLELEGA